MENKTNFIRRGILVLLTFVIGGYWLAGYSDREPDSAGSGQENSGVETEANTAESNSPVVSSENSDLALPSAMPAATISANLPQGLLGTTPSEQELERLKLKDYQSYLRYRKAELESIDDPYLEPEAKREQAMSAVKDRVREHLRNRPAKSTANAE